MPDMHVWKACLCRSGTVMFAKNIVQRPLLVIVLSSGEPISEICDSWALAYDCQAFQVLTWRLARSNRFSASADLSIAA